MTFIDYLYILWDKDNLTKGKKIIEIN